MISRAVQLAPTACNRQPFRLFLFRDPAMRAAICAKVPFPWLSEAPVIAVLAGDASSAWERPDGGSIVDVDASIVMEHFVLAATAEGLGTCWICCYDRAQVDAAAGIAAVYETNDRHLPFDEIKESAKADLIRAAKRIEI